MNPAEEKPWDGTERRYSPRQMLRGLVARYRLLQGCGGWRSALSGNASEGGILLLTRELIPEGVLVLVELETPTLGTFLFTGTVIWNREVKELNDMEFKHGVEFITVSGESRGRFQILLEMGEPGGELPADLESAVARGPRAGG